MNVDGFAKSTIEEFRGAQPERAKAELDPTRAIYVQNMMQGEFGLRPRDGMQKLKQITGTVKQLHHWTAEGIINPDRIVMYKGDRKLDIHYVQLDTDQTLATMPVNTSNVGIVELEKRLYVTPRFGLAKNGGVYIIDPNDSIADLAFAGPINATFAFTDLDVGETTPGLHNFAIICTSRSGFRGRLSPSTGAAVEPANYTVVLSGPETGRKIQVAVTVGAQTDIVLMELCMTSVDNPNRYILVPEQSAGIPPGGITFNFTADIADDTLTSLLASDSEVTESEFWITRGNGSTADPIGVIGTCAYGDRMVYNTGTVLYISEPGNPQQITADQHVQRLTNGKFCTGMFAIRGGLYCGSDNMIEAFTDSRNTVPAAWVPAAIVGGSQGFASQNCVAVTVGSNSGSSYAIIAARSGLWYFDGNFSQKPINYRQKDTWKRINWAASDAIQVVDDTVNQHIKVLAPIGSSTVANMVMVFDYSRARNEFGIIPTAIDYYEYTYDNADITAVAMFKYYLTNLYSFMVAKANGGNTDLLFEVQQTEVDDGVPYSCVWENGGMVERGKLRFVNNRFGGFTLKVEGTGFLHVQLRDLGDPDNVYEVDVELQPNPKHDWVSGVKINGQNLILRLEYLTNSGYLLVKQACIYFRPISNNVRVNADT